MAWKLRQFFEGDKKVTVSNIVTTSTCWANGSSVYVTNTIAIKVNSTEYILPTGQIAVGIGVITVNVPSSVHIGPTTTVQVYAVCEDLPESKTATLTAKPVDFQVTNSVIAACTTTAILNSSFRDYVRLFFTQNSGDFGTLKLNNTNLEIANFSYQTGDTGNVTSTAGLFSRPSTDTSSAVLISNLTYLNSTLEVKPVNIDHYWSARLGYEEIIFDLGTLRYTNYLANSEAEVSLGSYIANDVFLIESLPASYNIKKNGTVIYSVNKNITYSLSSGGGTISPTTAPVGSPVVWTLPTTAGTYTIFGAVNDTLDFQKSIQVHSCGTPVNDSYTGVYNTAFTNNISTNDTLCTGENTYFELVPGSNFGGTVVITQNTGAFTFTPTANFNSTAKFDYRLRCGADFATSEILGTATATINYYSPCNGVTANWQLSNIVRCNNCTEERQRVDLNATCTGNQPTWVANPDGNACVTSPIYTDENQTRCQACVSQKLVRDTNQCSPSYNTTIWINDNGIACNVTPNWQDTGSFNCVNCVEKKTQIDTSQCSPTYNTTRLVDNLSGTACDKNPNWQPTGDVDCIDCQEVLEESDTNPCSPTFNTTRFVANVGGDACTENAVWSDTGAVECQSGVIVKEQHSSNNCSENNYRWVASGAGSCNCTAQLSIKNICNSNELTTNPVVNVSVTLSDVVETNRLISFANNVISFLTDVGYYSYTLVLTHQNGIIRTVKLANYKCNTQFLISNAVSKINQQITFETIPVKTTTSAPFNLVATIDSNQTITFESSNHDVAIVAGNTVTIIDKGTTIITAKQLGNSTYNKTVKFQTLNIKE